MGTSHAASLSPPLGPERIDADGVLELLDVERFDADTPRERPLGRARLRFGFDLAAGLRFESETTGMAGGTPRRARGAGIYDFGHARQDISPSLSFDEAFLDAKLPGGSVRAGLLRFGWGKLDRDQPNDLLNPESFLDPFLDEERERKIGVPALAPTIELPSLDGDLGPSELRLTGVWAPIFVPYRFPDVDERWYPPLARASRQSEILGVPVENQTRFVDRGVPARSLAHGTFAGRLAGSVAGVDFAIDYFDGYDPAPVLGVDARGFVRRDPVDPSGLTARSEVEVFPVFDRIWAAGGELAWTISEASFRAEAAYVTNRGYNRPIRDVAAHPRLGPIDPALLDTGEEQEIAVELEPANVRRDGVEWGAGGDFTYAETFVLMQVNQTVILRNDVDLLVSDYETRLSATIRRNFHDDRIRAELLGLYGVQGVYGVVHPRITYALGDHWDVRVGMLWIGGHERSLIGQYRRNDEAYVRFRFLF